MSGRGLAYNHKDEYDNAIWDFNSAIQFAPNYAFAYGMRGSTYIFKGEYDNAIWDFNSAIRFNPNNSTYYGRGIAWLHLSRWEYARFDLTTAKNMGMDIITEFCNRYGSVSDFEQRYGVQLPADIAAMLTPP